jgi:glucosyl-dolichyl phosphate glucuronosyltransferase
MSYEISLVICTYNRCRYLPEALESIRNQNLPAEKFELVIVDNNSTDDTATIAQKFISDNPHLNARYVFEAEKGLSVARNRGLQEAASPIVNYVDDDAILSPGYLEAMLYFFTTHPGAAGAGGKVIPKYESGQAPEWMSKYLDGFIGKKDHGTEVRAFTEAMKYPVGCNMAYRKTILQQAGGFNAQLQFRSDDKFIFQQVKKISTQIFYVPDAWLYHYIDAHRLEMGNFKKLFLKTGNEEKKRISGEQGGFGVVKKGAEFLFKTAASLALLVAFAAKGDYKKGKYIFISQYNTLKGFLSKDVFVR